MASSIPRPLPRDNRLLALPRDDHPPDSPARSSSSTRPNRALTRTVALSQDHNKLSPPLYHATGLVYVNLGTRFPDMLPQRDGCGRSPSTSPS